MRTTITMLLLLGIFVLPLSVNAKAPNWYLERSLQGEKHDVIGYGKGSDEETAKENANSDVAQQVAVSILESITKSETKDRRRTWIIKKSREVKARLVGLTTIKLERKRKIWYVAVQYDNSKALDKVIWAFSKGGCVNEFSDPLTEFSRRVKEKIQCIPAWSLDYDQQKRHWILDVTTPENGHQKYSLRIDEFRNYIPDKGSEVLKVRPSKRSVIESKEGYYLVIDNNRAGWLYLFNVTEEGQSVLMESFGRQGPGKERQYPTKDTWCGYENTECLLMAQIPKGWGLSSAREYYLAVLCPGEADFHEHPIGLKVPDPDDPDTYGYGRLLRDIRRGTCDVAGSSLIVKREK